MTEKDTTTEEARRATQEAKEDRRGGFLALALATVPAVAFFVAYGAVKLWASLQGCQP